MKPPLLAQAMKVIPPADAKDTRTSLHQEVDFIASPSKIYAILLSSKEFTAFSGLPAEIDPAAGGTFSLFGGQIVGRNVELVPGKMIVQAWRPAYLPAGQYTMVRFGLNPKDAGTHLVLDHWGFPQGGYEHLNAGWTEHYWEPLRKYLA